MLLFISIAMLFMATALPAGYTGASEEYDRVRVRLTIGDDTKVTSLTVTLSGRYFVEQTGETIQDGSLYATVDTSWGNVTVNYTPKGGASRVLYVGAVCNILRVDPDISAGYFSLYNTYHTLTLNYLGDLTLRSVANSGASYSLRAINTVNMQQYLYGVVPNEMPEYCPLEALKAQAIASKGFACYKIGSSKPVDTYDIRDTATDQVYEGYKKGYPKSIAAVDATVKEALYFNGKLFPTYYSDCNGGETITPSTAWTDIKYYEGAYDSRPDPYDIENPRSRTEMTFFPAENTSYYLLNTTQPANGGTWYSSYAKTNDFLLAITKKALIASGQVSSEVRVNHINSIVSMHSTDTEGSTNGRNHAYANITLNANITANSISMKLNESAGTTVRDAVNIPIYGTSVSDYESALLAKLSPAAETIMGAEADLDIERAVTRFRSNIKPSLNERFSIPFDIADPITTDVTITFPFEMSQLYNTGVMTRTSLRIYHVEPAPSPFPGGYSVYHRRHGHGVGLSQRGAEMMAGEKYNWNYRQILAFYFPGATLGPFTKNIYTLDSQNGYITGLREDDTLERFILRLKGQTGAYSVEVKGVSDTGYVGTGCIVNVDGVYYFVIRYGDIDGNGLVTVADANAVLGHLVGSSRLSGVYLMAADADKNGTVDVLDATAINQNIAGLSVIHQ